jgi:hypothetical protein
MDLLNKKTEKGFLMIDTLVGLFVATLLATIFTTGMLRAVQISSAHTKDLHAELLAIELVEIARDIEQTATTYPFTACTVACHPITTGSPMVWELVPHSENLSGFTRQLTVSEIHRNPTTNEIESTGNLDPNTFKLTVTVTWETIGGTTKSIVLESYAYDFYEQW